MPGARRPASAPLVAAQRGDDGGGVVDGAHIRFELGWLFGSLRGGVD